MSKTLNDTTWAVPAAEIYEFTPPHTDYCLCIPVINEGARLTAQLGTMQRLGLPNLIDILILDGGSTDGSTAPDELHRRGIRSLLVKTGPGKLSAQLRMGYAYALRQGYKGIVTVDGNNKDGVEAVPLFVAKLTAGYDLIQGSRFIQGGKAINTPLSRLLAIRLLHAPLTSLAAGFRYTDTTNGFRGYSRRLLLDPRVQPFREIFETYELLAYLPIQAARLNYRVTEIPVTRRYPATGHVPTKISPWRGNIALLSILVKAVLGHYAPACNQILLKGA